MNLSFESSTETNIKNFWKTLNDGGIITTIRKIEGTISLRHAVNFSGIIKKDRTPLVKMFNKAIYSKVLFVFFCFFFLLCSCQKSFQDRKTLRTTRSEIVKINTELGITYMQNQQYDDAEEKLKKVIKIDPRNTDALNAMALLKSRTNQEKLADYYFQKALRADSNNPIINNNYGQFLCTIGLYKQGLNYLEIL